MKPNKIIMDWHCYSILIILMVMPLTSAWSSVGSDSTNAAYQQKQQINVSPYIDLVLCPIRDQPWSCARQQSGRILDIWDNELHSQWQKLKVEADRQLNSTMEKRGYSASEVITKEKPSTILKKLEIGTNFMKQYLAETMDGFLGREYEYLQNKENSDNADGDGDGNGGDEDDDNDNNNENEDQNDDDDDENENDENNTNDDEQTDDTSTDDEDNSKNQDNQTSQQQNENGDNENETAAITNTDNTSNGIEFIEIEESDKNESGQLKKPDGKKKKKKGQGAAPATVLVVQQPAIDHGEHVSGGHGGGGGGHGGHGHGGGGKPSKQKRKKRKKHQHGGGHGGHGGDEVVVVEEEPSIADHHFGLGLLEELADVDDLLDVDGGKRKKKHSSNYGRSNGVTRGKKKKKKKAFMKLVLLGSILKGKIELLLKILGAHLQIKFFAIALIGLLINIARFWIDVKRGGTPQKVVYVEHAHHQHHYEDHGGEEWSEPGGGYWKRSLQTEQSTVEEDAHTDSYQLKSQQYHQPQDAHYMAYRGQWQ